MAEKRLSVEEEDVEKSPVPLKRRRKSLSLGKQRFVLVESPEREKAAKGVIPKNTILANSWFERNLQSWVEFRSNSFPNDPVPQDILSISDADVLCKWLCRYVQETRRENGERYPPSTIRQLLNAFQRMLRQNKVPFNIMDKSDIRFRDLHQTLDTVCVHLRKDGIGANVKHASVLSVEDEELIWSSGVLSLESPDSLFRAVFFVVGLYFCLRGGQEHRELTVSQFSRYPDEDKYDSTVYYEYTENGSKNHQGQFTKVGKKNKVVRAHAQVGSNRCPVLILDTYLRKLPPNPSAFYLQWMPKVIHGKPWYKAMPVGVNTLKNMMSRICELAGLSSKYTNHSLRATATTRMFNAGVTEKVIAEFSGHKSMASLRQYERTSLVQEQKASRAIGSSGTVSEFQHQEKENFEAKSRDDKADIVGMVMSSKGTMSNCVFNFTFNN